VTDRRLHVLFVARWFPSHDQPGRGSFVADLARALDGTGAAEVVVASFDPTHVRGVAASRLERSRAAEAALARVLGAPDAVSDPRSWGVFGVPVARLPAILDGDRRRPADIVDAHLAPLLPFVRGLDERWPIDVIHGHTGLPDGVAALEVADALDVPLLVTEHASTTADDLADPDARVLYERLIGRPGRLVAVSHALAHDVARALGVADQTIEVLPNAVPIAGFPAGSGEGRAPAELLYVGNRKASKGIETLLGAVAEVRSQRPDVTLRLIGNPGPPADEARWEAVASEPGLSGAVTIEGAAPREAVAAAMRRATLFVHASPHETFGMVAAEALASGLPVAATPSGGVDEIVGRDGRFGAVATANTVPALADAIRRGLAGVERLDRDAMRAHVERNYASDAVARRTLDAYRAIGARVRDDIAADAEPDRSTPIGFRLPLVLALARGQAIERAGLLPVALRDRLTIVTSVRGRYADDVPLPGWAHWLELDPEAFYRDATAALEASAQQRGGLSRLRGALGGPTIEKQRRDLADRRDEVRREGIAEFLESAAAGTGGGGATRIVALDADDFLLADELGRGVGPLEPGGLRWLADAWDAAGRPD
jgi:glycosyltransferase involved in cell wall biosynthesis